MPEAFSLFGVNIEMKKRHFFIGFTLILSKFNIKFTFYWREQADADVVEGNFDVIGFFFRLM